MNDPTKAIEAGRRANLYFDGKLYWVHIRTKSGKSVCLSFLTLKEARKEHKYAEMGFIDETLFGAAPADPAQKQLF